VPADCLFDSCCLGAVGVLLESCKRDVRWLGANLERGKALDQVRNERCLHLGYLPCSDTEPNTDQPGSTAAHEDPRRFEREGEALEPPHAREASSTLLDVIIRQLSQEGQRQMMGLRRNRTQGTRRLAHHSVDEGLIASDIHWAQERGKKETQSIPPGIPKADALARIIHEPHGI